MPMPEGSGRAALSARSRIYRYLYDAREFCTKQVLAVRCGVSMPTLYQNLNELMEAGEAQFTGGRRAQGLDIVPDARVALGVSVSEHELRLVAADLRLHELGFHSLPIDLPSRLPYNASAFASIIEDFIDEFSIDRGKLLGVGITVPGLLSSCAAAAGPWPISRLKTASAARF